MDCWLLEVFQGLHGWCFDIYKLVENFGVYNVYCVHTKKIKKSKTWLPSFFIRKVAMIAKLPVGGLK